MCVCLYTATVATPTIKDTYVRADGRWRIILISCFSDKAHILMHRREERGRKKNIQEKQIHTYHTYVPSIEASKWPTLQSKHYQR